MPFHKSGTRRSLRLRGKEAKLPQELADGREPNDRQTYDYEDSKLFRSSRVKIPLERELEARVEALGSGEGMHVVDWGAGKGSQAEAIAVRWPHVRVTAFSKDSFPEWDEKQHENLSFMHAHPLVLARFLRKRVKGRQPHLADIVFTNAGMHHMRRGPMLDHLKELRHGLKPGGKIFFLSGASFEDADFRRAVQGLEGYEAEFTGNHLKSLTRV
jgi:trans-aconitate methyltransferase